MDKFWLELVAMAVMMISQRTSHTPLYLHDNPTIGLVGELPDVSNWHAVLETFFLTCWATCDGALMYIVIVDQDRFVGHKQCKIEWGNCNSCFQVWKFLSIGKGYKIVLVAVYRECVCVREWIFSKEM